MQVNAFQTGDHARFMGFANIDSMVRAALLHSDGDASIEETYRFWREQELATGVEQLAEGWSQKMPNSHDVWLSEKAVGDLAALSNSKEDRSVIGILRGLSPDDEAVAFDDDGIFVHEAGPHYHIYVRRAGERLLVARILPVRDWFAILLEKFMAGSEN